MENLLTLFSSRTSCKNFDSKKKIPENEIQEILEFIQMSPSMLNIQPWKIFVISDPMTKLKLKAASGNQWQVASNSHYLVFARRTNFDENFINEIAWENDHRKKWITDFLETMSDDEKNIWAMTQVSVALGCLLPFLASKNIQDCPIGVLNRKKYDEILSLNEKGFSTVFWLAIGYAMEQKNQKTRLPLKSIIEFI